MCRYVKTGRKMLAVLAAVSVMTGCVQVPTVEKTEDPGHVYPVVSYEVEPETFTLSIQSEGKTVTVSEPMKQQTVTDFKENGAEKSWTYPDSSISVSVKQEEDHLLVSILSTAEQDNEFIWPSISGEEYYMPFGEGKRIPANDENWGVYLRGSDWDVAEQLSMPFFAARKGEQAVTFIMEDPYRSKMIFNEAENVGFTLTNSYPQIDTNKEKSFLIYLTDSDPVKSAKIYRSYVESREKLVTLEAKSKKNPEVSKMYGAPQIYLWGENIISPDNINWPAFITNMDSEVFRYLSGFFKNTESGQEVEQTFEQLKNQDYVDEYQKNIICHFLSEILKREDFYDGSVFTVKNEHISLLLEKGIENLNHSGLLKLNKYALAGIMPQVFKPAEEWMNGDTVDLIEEIYDSGIDRAWIGLNSWEQGYAKPELVETAVEKGYLIGPYDSYHSIHEPGKEQWITAKFGDTSLYETATVSDQKGEKITGFQNVGRKLNPTLSLPAVKARTEEIMSEGLPFNSWFIDCDATGEIYDDYSPEHITTKTQDLEARLERMAYIRDQYGLVIGSEGGNDYAASDLVFAHGIELKSFSWIDEDMKKNKDSEYYIGKYYSPTGGVAEHFAKQIPVKEEYYAIFADPTFDLPLFKLVYNDSLITSYHWDWSTFKISGAVKSRMLREVLYNIPPLYHLDREEWEKYKEEIISHTKIWSDFSKKAVTMEMTDFENLTSDGIVQKTEYGNELTVIANFGDHSYYHGKIEIPAQSLIIENQDEVTIYTPQVRPEHQ